METLRDLRLQAKKTVAEVAKVLSVTENAIYNYESGYREIGIRQVLVLAALYGVSEQDVIIAQIYSCEK